MNTFYENIKLYNANLEKLTKLLKQISLLRLVVFIILVIILIYLFKYRLLTSILLIFPLVAIISFGIVIKYHSKIAYKKRHTEFLKKINESEILRDERKLSTFDRGKEFIDPSHPYTSDLDIFGSHSIFQLVNRTTTDSGKKCLAQWLSESASNNEIINRQEAIKELAPNCKWRQNFQASGMHFQHKKSDYNKLLEWIETPVSLISHSVLYSALAVTLSVLSFASLYYFVIHIFFVNWFTYLIPFIAVMLINSFLLRRIKPLAEDIVITSQENINTLKSYRSLISIIENETFKSEKLRQLQSLLTQGKYSAFKEINKLCSILDFSQQRGVNKMKIPIKGNAFYSILNFFLFLDVYMILETERWKLKNKASLESWSDIISEFEALSSLAGFSFSNPDFTFPELTEKNNLIHFEVLGHPLIQAEKRVCNNFHSEGHGSISMITGSNMGGKSTFLRTVGLNLVLGLAGAPCCSQYAKISNLKLYTSMRTQDNLSMGVSSFYAELKRVETILKLIETNENIFFLLDEMFKGTNSQDRHRGGFSLIYQMCGLKTSGIVATHDIELAKLLEKKSLVTNYSFNSAIKNNSMYFSYKLHQGICNDFNASELMRKSGINILSDIAEDEI